jgi:hypothetical protein
LDDSRSNAIPNTENIKTPGSSPRSDSAISTILQSQLARLLGNPIIHSFKLSRNRLARIWLDEAPPASFTPSSFVTRMIQPSMVGDATRKIAAIELSVPHGPQVSYALLGAELVASKRGGLEVEVSISSLSFPFMSSIALHQEEVRVGLLDQYAGAVITGIEKHAELGSLPIGVKLQFRWAAHGLIGSSPSIFEKVSGIVAQLLLLPKDSSEENLIALFG